MSEPLKFIQRYICLHKETMNYLHLLDIEFNRSGGVKKGKTGFQMQK